MKPFSMDTKPYYVYFFWGFFREMREKKHGKH